MQTERKDLKKVKVEIFSKNLVLGIVAEINRPMTQKSDRILSFWYITG